MRVVCTDKHSAPSTMASYNKPSSIGMAFAGKTASVDIPKPCDGDSPAGRESLAGVAGKPSKHHGMLPTPPNSISPNLPAHAFKRDADHPASPPPAPHHVDSDIDLQEAVEHENSQDQPQHGLSAEALDSLGDLDSAGAITPAMLAKHHLPNILLLNGPLAIRHIMGYLTTSVPGFSRITGAKARRLVVAALEGRGSGGEGAGLRGDVEFEKVGWGRWDARKRGQPSRERQRTNLSPACSHAGVPIPGQRDVSHGSSEKLGTSHADSGVFSHSEMEYGENEDVTMHEADKMSLDEDDFGYASSSPAPDNPNLDDDMASDATDEEDWASIGAEALRARSVPSSGAPLPRHLYQPVPIPIYSKASGRSRSRGRGTPSTFARSIPKPAIPVNNSTSVNIPSSVGGTQEREAIEALLSLGSM
jgi:Putative Sin3 binding protein